MKQVIKTEVYKIEDNLIVKANSILNRYEYSDKTYDWVMGSRIISDSKVVETLEKRRKSLLIKSL